MDERSVVVDKLKRAMKNANGIHARFIGVAIALVEGGAYVKDYGDGLYIFESGSVGDGPWAIKNGVCSCLDFERYGVCPHVLIMNILMSVLGR